MGFKVWTKLRDSLRFRWAKSKFDFVPSGVLDKFSFDSCHHIVVLKLDGKLGDTQVMTHFYAALRAHVPHITLSVVCTPNLAPIYQDILGFDQVLVSSRKPKAKEIKELCAKIKAMTPVSVVGSIAGKIDLVVTTEPNFRPRDFIFNYELAPRYVAGCETKVDSVNLLIYDPSKRTKAVAECFVDLMDLGHLAHGKIAYTRLVTSESLSKMRKWLHLSESSAKESSIAANESEDNHLTPRQQRFLLAINPRASSRSRSFTDEFTVKLLQELQAKFGVAHGYLTYTQNQPQSSDTEVNAANGTRTVTEVGKVETESRSKLAAVQRAGYELQPANEPLEALEEVDNAKTDNSGNSTRAAEHKVAHNEAEAQAKCGVTDGAGATSSSHASVKLGENGKLSEGGAQHGSGEKVQGEHESHQIARKGIQRDLEFVVLTPPHADELKAKVKAAAQNCGAAVFFLPDDSTVLDLSSTIDLCDALISVDTAAVHMACASHRPQLCVYTGTNLNESIRWAPLEEQAEVVRLEGKTVPEIPESMLVERASDFVQRYIARY